MKKRNILLTIFGSITLSLALIAPIIFDLFIKGDSPYWLYIPWASFWLIITLILVVLKEDEA